MKLLHVLCRSFGWALLILLPVAAPAQEPSSAVPVRYTQARELSLHEHVRLPGSVTTHVDPLIAAEVAGLVIEFPKREGDRVRKGDVLARLRTDERELRLNAAQGLQQEAQARLDRAERALGRARDLLASEAIADEQYEDAVSEFNAWQGKLMQLEAEIARLELDIERCTIRSLVGGVIVEERVEVGEWINVGSPIAKIVSLENLEVRVDLPERWYGQLARDSKAEVIFEALPGKRLSGTIVSVVPQANEQARTFPVRVAVSDPSGRVGIGMLAEVNLPVGEEEMVLAVPKDAVVSGPQGTVVWVIGTDELVAPVSVTRGAAMGAWVAVQGELGPGTKVVVRGNERLFPEQKVVGELQDYELP